MRQAKVSLLHINPYFYYFIQIESDGVELIVVLHGGAIYVHIDNQKQINTKELHSLYYALCNHCRGRQTIYFDTVFSLFTLFVPHPKSKWAINIPQLDGINNGILVAIENENLSPILINTQ